MADLNRNFGKRLSLLMGDKFSQGALAEAVGVSQATVSKYIKTGRVPEWHILLKIAKFFQVTTDYLLTGEMPGQKRKADPTPSREVQELLDQTREVLESKNKTLVSALTQNIKAFHGVVKPTKEKPQISMAEAMEMVVEKLSFVCPNPDCGKKVGSMAAPDDLSDVCPFCGTVTNAKIYADQLKALGVSLDEAGEA